jgi:two-component system chemotaxis response regulator CheY
MEKVLRTLIVEDEFLSRRLMHRLLEPYALCDIAVTGDEALQAVDLSCSEGTPYGLILLDTALPRTSATSLLTAIRSLEKQKRILDHERAKVVIVSGSGAEGGVEASLLRRECEGRVLKPINRGDFLGQLHSLGFLQA